MKNFKEIIAGAWIVPVFIVLLILTVLAFEFALRIAT